MTWEEKVEMVKYLNDGEYENAVTYISGKEVDNQAMDMFVTGFSLTKMELLNPIKELIMNFDSGLLDFRSGLRLEIMKSNFLKEERS
jgi:hypothetical protein